MPEVSDKYVRIPFTKGHSGKGHRLRTITISDAKGIKAIYCGTHKVIKTYLFATERWTMASAKKWVQAHKDGGKSMELDAVEVDGKEVLIEDLIEAYKAHEDVVGEGAGGEAGEKAGDESIKAVTKKERDGEHPAGHYLVVEDSKKVTTWHLRVKDVGGKLDHRLMGATWAALHGGYRGNKYEGPDKAKAITKLKKLYKQEDMELPGKSLELGDASLDEFSRQVRDAWYAQYKRPTAMTQPAGGDWWVKDVFEDHIVVDTTEGLYKYPYSVADDGAVTFGEPIEVELIYKPIPGKKSFDYCIKRLGETDTGWYIGGYGMIWGSGEQRDLSPWPNADGSSGEFFTLQTQGLDDLPVKVITFEHDKETGPDGKPFRHVLGTTVLERDDVIGRWIEALIEKRRKYAGYVVDLIDQEVLNFSSETASHWREVADDGEIKMWRTAGYTTTTHPMEPRLTDVNRLKAYYKSLDLDLAEPDTGGAPEDGGLEMEKAKAKARALLSRIRKGEVKEL